MDRFGRNIAILLSGAMLAACTGSDEIVQTASKYDINQNERMYYEVCIDDMKYRKVEFTGGASKVDGCACATKLILSEVPDFQMPALWEYRSIDKKLNAQQYKNVAIKHHLDEVDSDRLYRIVKTAFKLCENRSFHSRDMIAQISALKPKSYSASVSSPVSPPQLRSRSQPPKNQEPPRLRGRSKG